MKKDEPRVSSTIFEAAKDFVFAFTTVLIVVFTCKGVCALCGL